MPQKGDKKKGTATGVRAGAHDVDTLLAEAGLPVPTSVRPPGKINAYQSDNPPTKPAKIYKQKNSYWLFSAWRIRDGYKLYVMIPDRARPRLVRSFNMAVVLTR